MTRTGLYLQGGGAKGAYQAGLLKAFQEAGLFFEALSGTSIGSLNGYFWAGGQTSALETLWLDMALPETFITPDGLFLRTDFLLEQIRRHPAGTDQVRHWFVNYAQVSEGRLVNLYEDLAGAAEEEILRVVGRSMRLPLRDENNEYDLGLYEGRFIDGGMVNNAFVEPLTTLGLDEIVVLPLNNDFVSDHLAEFKGKVTVMEPTVRFVRGDTVRMDRDVIRMWFEQGYESGRRWCGSRR